MGCSPASLTMATAKANGPERTKTTGARRRSRSERNHGMDDGADAYAGIDNVTDAPEAGWLDIRS